MVDGTALLMTPFHAPGALGPRGSNIADGAAYFYRVYECGDGDYVSVGSIEPQFHGELRRLLELSDPTWDEQMNRSAWPERGDVLAAVFKTKTREEWCSLLEGSDVCFAPVLTMTEARAHRHNVARHTFVDVDGIAQPAPAPRFSRTPTSTPRRPVAVGSATRELLAEAGFSSDSIAALEAAGVVASATGDD
jgi:alpha-methylacyl-CoA racemase